MQRSEPEPAPEPVPTAGEDLVGERPAEAAAGPGSAPAAEAEPEGEAGRAEPPEAAAEPGPGPAPAAEQARAEPEGEAGRGSPLEGGGAEALGEPGAAGEGEEPARLVVSEARTALSRPGNTEVLPGRREPAAEPAYEPAALIGTVLSGRFRLDEVLGEGGMGVVYRAEHTLMRKTVAVKVLHPELTTVDEMVRRFEREAQAAANIDHENVCRAHDFGRAESGAFYLVMEYLEGQSLDALLRDQGSLRSERAIGIAVQICNALERAHAMGIVHRDLKPENILLVERDGRPDHVKVLDFGIARVPVDDSSTKTLTRAGIVMGTPSYLSPEQATGFPTDHRTDLYSLGVTLFEMVAGRKPFDSPSVVELLGMHATRPPPRLGQLAGAARVTPRLERLVASLLAKEPHKRPAGAAEVRDELQLVLRELDNTRGRLSVQAVATATSALALAAPAVGRLRPVPRWAWLGAVMTLVLPLGWGAWLLGHGGGSEPAPAAAPPTSHWRESPPPLAPAPEHRGAPAPAPAPPSPLDEVRARPEVKQALDRREEGGTKAVVQELSRLYKRQASPELAFLLGEAEAQAGESRRALQHAQAALDGNPELARDEGLRAFVATQLDSPRNGWLASRIVESHLMPDLAPALGKVACADERTSGRRRAAEVLRKAGALDRLAPYCRLVVELELAESCEARRAVVRRMGELGDPRALPALDRVRQGKEGALFWKRQVNACLGEDLRRSRAALRKAAGAASTGDDD